MRLLAIYSHNHSPQNGLDEIEEQFYESQENRARILNSLYDKNLPVDVSQSFSSDFSVSTLPSFTTWLFPTLIDYLPTTVIGGATADTHNADCR